MESAQSHIAQYLALRKKENRIYTDAQLRMLPNIERTHPHCKEWIARKRSADWLIQQLSENSVKSVKSVIEVGCGNGWLANRIASAGMQVTAIDVNLVELQQGKAVFKDNDRLHFRAGDLYTAVEKNEAFDAVVFAASIQYFSSFETIIQKALAHLRSKGRIYIIDSHFYKNHEITAARQRTIDYYTTAGFASLSEHYFHHPVDVLASFNTQVLYDPRNWKNVFRRKHEPFHRICIQKS
ncbi:MAG TPA: class I SAM-dependent methyltransferase [Chitinophagaceae bacterium]|nr:class I SAM-dependent methyltransferase [Chitinophagaceae bacterium]